MAVHVEHDVLADLLNILIHSVAQFGVVAQGILDVTVEVHKQLSETAPFLLILVEELLTQVAELVLLHLDDEVVNTLNLIFYLSSEEAF